MNIEKQITFAIASMLLVTVITSCSNSSSHPERLTDRSLSPEKIQELRKEYPLSIGAPVNVNLRDLTFKEVLDHTDSVIIAEVIQQIPDISVELITAPGTPEGNLTAKEQEAGMNPYKPEFTSFQVNVKEVITGEEVENTINLIYNSDFKDIEPNLKPGMKIVVAIKNGVGAQQEGSYSFTRYGTYYVVEGDYVLSAYEGQSEEMRDFTLQTNGKPLENLISEIRGLKN